MDNSTYEANRRRRQARTKVLPGFAAADKNNTEIMLSHSDPAIRDSLGLTRHSPEMITEIDQMLIKYVSIFETLARQILSNLSENWRIRYRVDWRKVRERSYGGRYSSKWRSEVFLEDKRDIDSWQQKGSAISLRGSVFPLSMKEWDDIETYHEYRNFCMDVEIGDYSGSRHDLAVCTIAHECAHAVQFTKLAISMGQEWWYNIAGCPEIYKIDKRVEWFGGHELLFQCIYRLFRRKVELINSLPVRNEEDDLQYDRATKCLICAKPLLPKGRGRVKKFCSETCRSRAWRNKAKL